MRQAHGRVRHVDVLTAGAARSVGVDAEILVFDFDLDVLRQFRPDEQRRERRVPARGLVERGYPDEPVHARLGKQHPVGVIAGNRHRRALDTCLVARLEIDDVALEPAPLRPAQVHPEQHLSPVLRLRPAGPGVNRHDGVLAIVFAAEHLLGLAGIDFLRQLGKAGREIVEHRFAGLQPLHQHGKIFNPAPERGRQVAILLEPPAALAELLSRCLVFPEIRVGDALLYEGEFFGRAGGVKDSSADRRRGAPGPDICEAVRRGW